MADPLDGLVPGGGSWVGANAPVINGAVMNINQTESKAILNWQQLNLRAGETLNFNQASASWAALNRINSLDPSIIAGNVNALGHVYFINSNGIIFGNGAQINVGSLTASSLNITDTLFKNGVISDPKIPSFSGTKGFVQVDAGANLNASAGGRIMLLAPDVTNAGVINTPEGQTILAAGQKVYLASSTDPAGLLVEVSSGGTATNLGDIVSKLGNVTLVGLAVNQQARISASTSVRANGSIRLLARDTNYNSGLVTAQRGGVLSMASASLTKIDVELGDKEEILNSQLIDTSGTKVLGLSKVELNGGVININGSIVAHGGDVTATAKFDPFKLIDIKTPLSDAVSETRVYLGGNGSIDVSGLDATAPMSRNQIALQLYSEQLKDTPLLRGTDFLGKTIYVDARKGTDLIAADALEAAKAIKGIAIAEVMSKGGNVTLQSSLGDVILVNGSKVDVSGGSIKYESGFIRETQLQYKGNNVDISAANKSTPYEGFADTYSVVDKKWGATRSWDLNNYYGNFYQGYISGIDAGAVSIFSKNSLLEGDLRGFTKSGYYQRDGQVGGGSFNFKSSSGFNSSAFRFVADNTFGLGDSFLPVGEFNKITNKFLQGDALPEGQIEFKTNIFSTDKTQAAGGFTRINLDAGTGIVSVDASVATAPKGVVSFKTSGVLNVNANITSPGGLISISAGKTILANNVNIITSGIYTNDTLGVSGSLLGDIVIDGGAISITQNDTDNGSIAIGQGVRIESNAGAWLNTFNELKGGKGGNITLTGVANLGDIFISAYGFSKGGSLSLSAYRNLQAGSQSPNVSSLADTLWLPESFFSQGGFSQYSIKTRSTGSNIIVGDPEGARSLIHPQTEMLRINTGYRSQASRADIKSLASLMYPANYLNQPASIAFTSQGKLTLENNSVVFLDESNTFAGGTILIQSMEQMTILGNLIAPAGSINISLIGSMAQYSNYDSSISLFVGPNALVSARGSYAVTPSNNGIIKAVLLDAGSITLNGGDRAVVVLKEGSVLDVSGISGEVDLSLKSGYTRQKLDSSAGQISIIARNGMVLDGDMNASASGSGKDGSLSLAFLGDDDTSGSVNPYPNGSRTLELSQNREIRSKNLDFASSWSSLTGIGVVSSEQIYKAGFGTLILQADRIGFEDKILFSSGLDLHLQDSLILNSSLLQVTNGGRANIGADYLMVTGNRPRPETVPLSGNSEIQINAKWIDLIGNIGIAGVRKVGLNAEKDIRGRGIVDGLLNEGSFFTNGALNLTARQIYPVTNGFFSFQTAGNLNSIEIKSSSLMSEDVPFSAGGRLTIKAFNITQGGSLYAPLGSLYLLADNELTFKPGSFTSISAEGKLIPFGLTRLGGLELQAPNPALTAQEKIDPLRKMPDKKISIKALNIEMDDGANINISGGGDTLAYEWVKGIGGSTDILGQKGTFAVLPTIKKGEYAPFDYNYTQPNLGITPGDSIYLAGVKGLADGEYAILPARYALLPGAFMVQASTKAISQASSAVQVNGSTLVSTYKSNGIYRDTNYSVFEVTDASIFHTTKGEVSRATSDYRFTYGNQFFTKLAEESGFVTPRLSSDAGQFEVNASNNLVLNANFLANKAASSLGGLVDIASNKIKVVSELSRPVDKLPGVLELTARSLNNLNAESLLLGGSRTAKTDGSTEITAGAVSLEFANNNQNPLSVKELIAASTKTLTVASGANIITSTATGSSANSKLTTTGPGALLAVSSLNNLELERTSSVSTGDLGNLSIAADSNIIASRSIVLDSSDTAKLDGYVTVSKAGSISLGAGRILLGDSGAATGLKISNSLLSSFGQLSKVTLNSYKNIDIYGAVDLGNDTLDLTLNAGAIAGRMTSSQTATLRANNFILKNSLSGVYETVNNISSTTLIVEANNLQLVGGINNTSTTIAGFNAVQLNAAKEIAVAGLGATNINASTTSLKSSRISAATASDFTIAATGVMITTLPTTQATLDDASNLGARLTMNAQTLTLGGKIDLPSGYLFAKASTGDLTVSGQLKATSVPLNFDKYTEYTPAGNITLQTDLGNVVVGSSGLVDVSGKHASGDFGGDAGTINIISKESSTIDGSLKGLASAVNKAGSFVLDTNKLPDFSKLNSALNTGGFTNLLDLRVRSGDVNIAAGDTVIAKHVILSADAGKIDVFGSVNANGINGGKIEMYASGDLTLKNGANLLAKGTGQALVAGDSFVGAGGSVLLSSLSASTSAISAAAGALIDVSSSHQGAFFGEKGRVTMRAYRGSIDDNTVNVALTATAAVKGAGEVRIEGVKIYNSNIFAADTLTIVDDTNAFYEAHSGTSNYSATQDSAIISILPNIEVRSGNEINLNEDVNLKDMFPLESSLGGTLTLRAKQALRINGSLSDGFDSFDPQANLMAGDTFSYNLVAGADLLAANPMNTVEDATNGSFYLAQSKLIRTGTGAINIAASANLIMGNASSVIYTVGKKADDTFENFYAPATALYLDNGGDINFNIKGDILGAIVSSAGQQIITPWLYRQGGGTRPVSWWVRPDLFAQGVAAFGGGNVTVNAGGSITNFSVSVPTTAQYDKLGYSKINGGGDINVVAGKNINSGIYFAGRGYVNLVAGKSILATQNNLATMVALQDASVEIKAVNGIVVESVFNPTLWMQSGGNADRGDITGRNSNFISYGSSSKVRIKSLLGNIQYGRSLVDYIPLTEYQSVLEITPPSFDAIALKGDIKYGRLLLAPSSSGNLFLLASENIMPFGQSPLIGMSNSSSSVIPTVLNPVSRNTGFDVSFFRTSNSSVPLHLNDFNPAVVVAKNGSILLPGNVSATTSAGPGLKLPKSAYISAGNDIAIYADIQNIHSDDITIVSAGRDLTWPSSLGPIRLSGPGELLIKAGRNVSLGSSQGILTVANTLNPALPSQGASITVLAGAGTWGASIADYVESYINPTGLGPSTLQSKPSLLAAYRSDTAKAVASYMRNMIGNSSLSEDAAMTQYLALDLERQSIFAYRHFSSELLASGKGYAESQNHDRGDNAIASLFPSERIYKGDLSVYNSQIRTSRDGSVDILTPGGFINAGVPTSSGNNIGIVTERGGSIRAFAETGFQVEQSKIITQYGSDITVWVNNGDIDAGRGSKTALSVPQRVVSTNADGKTTIEAKGAAAGSGIRAQTYDPDGPTGVQIAPPLGSVALIAPRGILNASEAGIAAGNFLAVATQVLGANNITVTGSSSGVPVASTGSVAGAMTGVSNAAADATKSIANDITRQATTNTTVKTPMPSLISVEVIGLGD
jgi:filamentous hemagglutinin family protein